MLQRSSHNKSLLQKKLRRVLEIRTLTRYVCANNCAHR